MHITGASDESSLRQDTITIRIYLPQKKNLQVLIASIQ